MYLVSDNLAIFVANPNLESLAIVSNNVYVSISPNDLNLDLIKSGTLYKQVKLINEPLIFMFDM